jgi:5-formyltetrahydrofolate cyclo-ligase
VAHALKAEIRRKIKGLIAVVDRRAESAAIVKHIESLLPADGLILAFQPLPDEPEITPILDRLRKENRLILVPMDRETRSIVPPDRPIAMILVPGRAFDRCGTRLGRGGGAYDRILAGLQAPKIGVAFACQIVDSLPRESHDVPMAAVVTSREIIRIG